MEIAITSQQFIAAFMARAKMETSSAPASARQEAALRQWLRENLDKMGRNARSKLAHAMGKQRSVINKILDEQKPRKISAGELRTMEEFFGAGAPRATDLIRTDGVRMPSVRVVGYAGAGAEAHFYNVPEADLDVVPAPPGAGPETRAIQIRGVSLGRPFNRWYAYYRDHREDPEPFVGELCVVGLFDDRVLIKTIRRSKTPGYYDLESSDGEIISNVRIKWAARVFFIGPGY